ncbi:MAG TPA: phosphohydrolase, partial [Candidatus Lokiarchaeia archaeon]
VLLARGLQKTTKYKNYITENYINDLQISSILHDIRKVGIEDKILLKRGKLTNEEFEKIKMHPII